MLYINDYEMAFERNPGFMPDTEWTPQHQVSEINMMADMNTAYSALRSGEVDDCMPEGNWGSLERGSKCAITERIHPVSTLFFNLMEGSKMNDINLRQAYAMQSTRMILLQIKEGTGTRAHSTLTMIPTERVERRSGEVGWSICRNTVTP